MMTNHHDKQTTDLAAYQRSLCDEKTLLALDQSTQPSPARFYSVACGESEWTAQEREIIDADPRLREYEGRMRAAVRSIMPRPVTIPLRRVVSDALAGPELRAVARPACQSSDTVRFMNAEEGFDVQLFP